jgi:hypothetical protein
MNILRISGFIASATIALTLSFSGALAKDATRACDDAAVLKSISKRFHAQSHVVHQDRLRIEAFDRVHQHRASDKSEFHPIARRYCGATATLSDGRRRDVWYLIESNAGLAGLGNNVEFCVSGFDRWNVYDAYCRVLR